MAAGLLGNAVDDAKWENLSNPLYGVRQLPKDHSKS